MDPLRLLVTCAPLVAALSGCVGGLYSADDCKEQGPYEFNDESLGTHVATLTWIWTGAVTELSVTGTAGAQTPSSDCQTQVAVEYELSTADGAIDQTVKKYPTIASDGPFNTLALGVDLDAQRVLASGVAPQLSELAKRQPRLRLIVPKGVPLSEAELRLLTDRDDVRLGVIQFRSTP